MFSQVTETAGDEVEVHILSIDVTWSFLCCAGERILIRVEPGVEKTLPQSKEFPSLRKLLWKEYFWSRSFCLLTTGGAPLETIKRYIENQGERNH